LTLDRRLFQRHAQGQHRSSFRTTRARHAALLCRNQRCFMIRTIPNRPDTITRLRPAGDPSGSTSVTNPLHHVQQPVQTLPTRKRIRGPNRSREPKGHPAQIPLGRDRHPLRMAR